MSWFLSYTKYIYEILQVQPSQKKKNEMGKLHKLMQLVAILKLLETTVSKSWLVMLLKYLASYHYVQANYIINIFINGARLN